MSHCFEPGLPGSFNDDDAVVRHELAHAAVWFVHGGGMGPMRLSREMDGLLGGGAVSGPRDAQEATNPQFHDLVAERLLAGEISARKHLGLPINAVCIPNATASDLSNAAAPRDLIRFCRRPDEDIAKVLQLAERQRGAWMAWLVDRLSCSARIVDGAWRVLERAAGHLETLTPRQPGETLLLSGPEVVDLLYRHGLRPRCRKRPPVELVAALDAGDFMGSAKRWWRHWVLGRRYHVGV